MNPWTRSNSVTLQQVVRVRCMVFVVPREFLASGSMNILRVSVARRSDRSSLTWVSWAPGPHCSHDVLVFGFFSNRKSYCFELFSFYCFLHWTAPCERGRPKEIAPQSRRARKKILASRCRKSQVISRTQCMQETIRIFDIFWAWEKSSDLGDITEAVLCRQSEMQKMDVKKTLRYNNENIVKHFLWMIDNNVRRNVYYYRWIDRYPSELGGSL